MTDADSSPAAVPAFGWSRSVLLAAILAAGASGVGATISAARDASRALDQLGARVEGVDARLDRIEARLDSSILTRLPK